MTTTEAFEASLRAEFEALPEFLADPLLLQRQLNRESYVYTLVQGMWEGYQAGDKAARATIKQSLTVAEALMPEPFGYVPFPGEFYPPDQLDAEVKDDPFTTRVYTAAQMRAMFDAATERAAKQCEERADELSKQWRAGHKTNAHLEGQSDGAFDCAAAIRGTP